MSKINRLKEELAYSSLDNPWVKLYFDSVRFSNGVIGKYNRVVESEGRPGVAVLPMMNAKVCLVQQYRYPIGKSLWEIPRGFGESINSLEDAARELAEETGIQHARMIDAGCLHPNSGLLSSEVILYIAIVDQDFGEPFSTDEVASKKWFSVSELWAMISEGQITDCFTLSAMAIAQSRGLVN